MQLIAKGESDVLDFKKEISSASKIAKTMVAFANNKGGRLLIGVRDDKTIAGVKTEEEKYMLDLAANFYCKPVPDVLITTWKLDGKMVLEALIKEGNNKPYYAKGDDNKWWVYIRAADQSLLASKITVNVLKRNAQQIQTVIKYSSKEQALFQLLQQHNKVTLNQFARHINVSRWRASKILVNLISIGMVREHTHEQTAFYTLC